MQMAWLKLFRSCCKRFLHELFFTNMHEYDVFLFSVNRSWGEHRVSGDLLLQQEGRKGS